MSDVLGHGRGQGSAARHAVEAGGEQRDQEDERVGRIVAGAELDVPPVAHARNAHQGGAVADAPADMGRRPGAGLQALVGVDDRRADAHQRPGVGQQAGDDLTAQRRQRRVVGLTDRQVAGAFAVPQAEVNVQARAGQMRVGLGHEGRDHAGVARQGADDLLVGQIIVDRLERLAIARRALVLPGAILLAELLDLDVHAPQGVDDALPERIEAIQAGEREHPAALDRLIFAIFAGLEQDQLGLEPDADGEVLPGKAIEHP